jgi:hypothetical protein
MTLTNVGGEGLALAARQSGVSTKTLLMRVSTVSTKTLMMRVSPGSVGCANRMGGRTGLCFACTSGWSLVCGPFLSAHFLWHERERERREREREREREMS